MGRVIDFTTKAAVLEACFLFYPALHIMPCVRVLERHSVEYGRLIDAREYRTKVRIICAVSVWRPSELVRATSDESQHCMQERDCLNLYLRCLSSGIHLVKLSW